MSSTVTPSTISLVTTLTTSDSLTLIIVLLLLALLIAKELASAFSGPRAQRMRYNLNIAIVPLLISFIIIAISKFAGALQ